MKRKGMKPGTGHTWTYHKGTWKEVKLTPRKWKFTYTTTKTRKGRKAPYGTGMPIGSKLHWKIIANQYALKTTPNKYKLITKGIKYRQRHTTKKGHKLRR